jgi:hypothetical protein
METTKPLNPSSKPGEADDLIEELARMMAAGAKDKVAGATEATNPPSGSGAPVSEDPVPPGFSQTGQPETTQTGPSDAPVRTPLAGLTGESGAGGTLRKSPPPYRVPTPDTTLSSGSGVSKPVPGSTAGADQSASSGQTPVWQKTASPVSPAAERGQSAVTPPPITTPATTSQPTPAIDPIAELIRQQVSPAKTQFGALRSDQDRQPPKSAIPAPSSPVGEPSATQTRSSEAGGEDGFRIAPVFGLGGVPSTPSPVPPTPTVAPVPSVPAKPMGGSSALDEIEQLIGNAVHVDVPPDSDQFQESETAREYPAPDSNLPGEADLPEEPVFPKETALPEAQVTPVSQVAPVSPVPPTPQASEQAPIPQAIQSQPLPTSIFTPPVGDPALGGGNVEAAEAAILQAMASDPQTVQPGALPNDATGPGEAPVYEEPLLAGAYVAPQKKPASTVRRYVVPLVAVLFLGAAGAGGYFFLNSGGVDGEAPVLLADGTPNKTIPEPQSPQTRDQSVVFEGIDGSAVPDTEQKLVSRDQTDGATVSDIRQVITIDNTEAGLANRRVRTVTVRPDGTIISGDDAVAGGTVLPVAQPSLPDLPASAIDSVLASTTVTPMPDAADLTAGTELSATPAATPAGNRILSVNGTTVPFPRPRIANRAALAAQARATPVTTPQVNTPAPSTTPVNSGAVDLLTALTGQPESAPPTPVNIVAPPPAPIAQPVQQTTSVSSQAVVSNSYVQLASLRAQDVADETAAALQRRYSSALGGGSLVVRRVDLGDRGIFFRVLLPTASLGEASAVCTNIQNSGGDCFPRNN